MVQKIPTEIWVLLIRRSDIPYLNRSLAGLNLLERHVREALQWNIRQIIFWLEPPTMPYDQALVIEFDRVKSRLERKVDRHFIRSIQHIDELSVHEAELALAAPHLSLFTQQWISAWSFSVHELYKRRGTFEEAWGQVSVLPEMDEWKEGKNATVFYVPLRTERDWGWAQRRLGVEIVEQSRSGILGKNLNRRISLFISRFLVQFDVSPMVWTAWNIVFGICAASFMISPHYGSRLTGALIFYWSCIFDGVDGEIARFRFESSEKGALFDMATSWFNTLLFFGTCLFSAANSGEISTLSAEGVLLVSSLCVIGLSLYFSSIIRVPMGQGAWSTWDDRYKKQLRSEWISTLFRKESFAMLSLLAVALHQMQLLIWGILGILILSVLVICDVEWRTRQFAREKTQVTS